MDYHVRVQSDVRAPKEYKQQKLQAARREVGNKLYDILISNKLPAVVDIEEIEVPYGKYSSTYPVDELEIRVHVEPVLHRHITMAHAELEWQPIMIVGKHPVKQVIGRALNFVGRLLR